MATLGINYHSYDIKEVNLSSLNTAGNIKVNVYNFFGDVNGNPKTLNPGYFKLEATCGNQTVTVNNTAYRFTGENVVQTINWTPPISWASQNTTGTSVTVILKLLAKIDFLGNEYTIYNTKTVSISIPTSVKPSTSMALSDTMGYLSKYGSYIRYKSKVKVQLTNTLSYNSPISSYNIKANGVTYTTNPVTTDVLKTAGTNTITAYVTDKRGRSSNTVSKNITVLDYANPSVSFSVRRCNEDGTLNENGGYCKVTYSVSISSLSNKNSKTLKLSYKVSSESTTTDVTLPMTSYSVTNQNYIFQASDDKSYNVSLSATDDFITTTKSTVLSTAFTLMHFNKSGKGLAIGKISEGDKFEVAMPAEFKNGINGIPDLKSAIDNAGLLPTTEIPANTNLNTVSYCNVGRYYCPYDVKVATLSNCPTLNAFVMEVYSPISKDSSISPTGNVYRVRKILDYLGNEYIQSINIYNNTPTYSTWNRILKSNDIDTSLSTTSTNPVQNKAITTALNGKQATITVASGTATWNTTYGGTVSSRGCLWRRYGRMVTVYIYDAIMTPSCKNDASTSIIATGLPKAAENQVAMLVSVGATQARRVGIAKGGTSVLWWWNPTVTANTTYMSGSFTYLCE